MFEQDQSIEEMLMMLYQAQMRMFRADCERVFAPLEDLVKDDDFQDEDTLVFAV